MSANHDQVSVGFGSAENDYTILKNGKEYFTGRLSKSELAQKIELALDH